MQGSKSVTDDAAATFDVQDVGRLLSRRPPGLRLEPVAAPSLLASSERAAQLETSARM